MIECVYTFKKKYKPGALPFLLGVKYYSIIFDDTEIMQTRYEEEARIITNALNGAFFLGFEEGKNSK